MDVTIVPPIAGLAGAGIAAGLWLLARGLVGYRTATRIADTGTSSVASIAAGEVRVAGIIEPAEVTLISPLQSERCVYYRATIDTGDDGIDLRGDDEEERAVGFMVRDATGTVRIFPRGARWDAPVLFDATTGSFGDEPPDLNLRRGSATAVAEQDRDAALAELLSSRPAIGGGGHPMLRGNGSGRRHYTEARLAPGDAVTVVGRALPFSDLADPMESDFALGSEIAADDTEVTADLAEARAAGQLADDPDDAWGNAAIPGFGIGRPVRAPDLDLAAHTLPLAPAEDAARYERTFYIAPATLIVASAPDVGAILAIASAMIGVIMLGWRVRYVSPSSIAALFALVLVVIVVGFLAVTSYNAVMALRQRIDKAWSNIDVTLKQRHDQLPSLVSAVKGVLAFEQDVLSDVTRARAAYSPTRPIPDQAPSPTKRRLRSAPCSRWWNAIQICGPGRTSWTSRTRSSAWSR